MFARVFIQREAWCMGPYATVDYNSHHSQLRSHPYPTPLQRERGEGGKISRIGSAYLYLSANFQNKKRKMEITKKGERSGES